MSIRPLLSILCASVALLCWTLASPIGASPDDDYHLPSIWCGRGNVPNQCEVPAEAPHVLIPAPFNQGVYCYAFRSGASAACQQPISNWRDTALTTPSRSNAKSALYPPGYYYVMSFLVFDNIKRSALSMRVLNCALAVLLFALLQRFARGTPIQFAATWVPLVISIPLGLFCIASNNPSSWTIIGVGTFWGFFYLLLRSEIDSPAHRRRLLTISGCAILSASLAIWSRVDGSIYISVSALCALLANYQRLTEVIDLRHRAFTLAVGGITVLSAALAFVFLGQGLSVASKGLADVAPATRTVAQLLFENLRSFPDLWSGAVGGSGLGWLDTALPRSVVLIVFGIAFYLIVAGMQYAHIGKTLAFCLCITLLSFFPVFVLTKSGHIVGETVQPRYLLPLLYLLTGIALTGIPAARQRVLSPTTTFVFAILLSIAHSLALHQNIRRYTVGLKTIGFDLNYRVEWWWLHAPSPMTTWIVGSIAFLVVTVLTSASTLNRDERVS